MKTRYEVRLANNPEVLAAFQLKEWAIEWRDRMCATAEIYESARISSPLVMPRSDGNAYTPAIPQAVSREASNAELSEPPPKNL